MANINHENLTIFDLISSGFVLLENKDLKQLNKLAKTLIEKDSKCFFGYCFKAISETGIDITKPISGVNYQLNDKDIQEDVKTRIYYYARMKYIKTPQSKYEAICSFYPDIPGEKRNEWNRGKTNYDKKKEHLTDLYNKYLYIEQNYIHDLEIYSISEKEVAIVHNLKLWGEYLKHGLESLEDYDKEVETFVKNDFKKTPNPGNPKAFLLYSFFLTLAFLLFAFTVSRTTFYFVFERSEYRIFEIIIAIASTVIMFGLTVMFISRSKIFSKLHPVLISFFILIDVLMGTLNIVSAFTENQLGVFVGSFIAAVALFSGIFSILKLRYYYPRNTYKCGSYIGNYKALCSNNFKVSFSYQWKTFKGNKELEVGDVGEYLAPYMK